MRLKPPVVPQSVLSNYGYQPTMMRLKQFTENDLFFSLWKLPTHYDAIETKQVLSSAYRAFIVTNPLWCDWNRTENSENSDSNSELPTHYDAIETIVMFLLFELSRGYQPTMMRLKRNSGKPGSGACWGLPTHYDAIETLEIDIKKTRGYIRKKHSKSRRMAVVQCKRLYDDFLHLHFLIIIFREYLD